MSTALVTTTKKSKMRMRTGKFLWQFLLYLSPVVLLTSIFPLVTPQIDTVNVGGVNLTQIILAVSITVPWMSQSVCLPIYRAMSDLLGDKELDPCMKRFCEYWISTCLAVMPVLLIFGLPFYFAFHWSATALLAFFILGFLNMAFGQLLVIANLPTSRNNWAIAWLAYALSLLLLPTVWFLPPLAGIAVQLVVMRKYLRHLGALKKLPYTAIAKEMLRGFLMGTVLWADKYVLFIAQDGQMDVVAVYMGLIPAVIAYNYFFAAEATPLDGAVGKLRNSIQHNSYPLVQRFSQRVEKRVLGATRRTLVLAAVSSVIVAAVLFFVTPQSFGLALAVIVASWFFLAVTVLSYQVDYIGSRVAPQVIGAVHLLLCIIAFSVIPSTGGYLILMLGEAVLAVASYIIFRKTWATPAYDLFWRHAMAW